MKAIRCDRCDAVIKDGDNVQVALVATDGDMKPIAEDLCERCERDLREFLRPLPRAAVQDEGATS